MTRKEFENKYRYMSEFNALAKSHCRYVLKQGGEDFAKILQSIKKVPNRAWIPAGCFWKDNDSELQRYSLSCLRTITAFLSACSCKKIPQCRQNSVPAVGVSPSSPMA